MRTLHIFFVAFIVAACSAEKSKDQSTAEQTPIPAAITQAIVKEFPGAMPYPIAIDSLLAHLSHFGITPTEILWGQSTCVDDITNTKEKFVHPEIKGPFMFGGLGGIPFTGISGVGAFAHHIPEDGTALLFVGPHIGYTDGEGWGKILRHGQEHTSSCCGALYGALDKLKKKEIKVSTLFEEDYQEEFLEQLALRHQKEILNASEPLVKLTQVVFHEAEREITEYARKVHERHFAYAVVVVGVIINTDYQFDDYLWIDHIAIKDIKQDRWIEERHTLNK